MSSKYDGKRSQIVDLEESASTFGVTYLEKAEKINANLC